MSTNNQPRAALRTNVFEDRSETYDVLISDGIDGDNQIEINVASRSDARDLLAILDRAGFHTDSFFNPCF